MRFKNYIWDFDGTLYDTYGAITTAFLESLKLFGIQATPKEVYQLIKKESARFAAEHYVGLEKKQALMRKYQEIEPRLQESPKPFHDARETLESIVQNGGKNFVLTHRDNTALEFLKQDGLFHCFTDFVTVADDFPLKPDPSSILHLMKKHELAIDETVMIGDRKLDVLAGKNAEVSAILYDIDGFLGEIPADFTVHSLAEILLIPSCEKED
ncbi:haloacid dehalogenase superfamily, subfamily IA, variant 3 with third motif having DD or ED/haloacid dehalogenase superfamily, subfamily IA, variant 1 with third motif having Dx(3-4)D or Dx(3-4)E [Pilibacter termitis]|uniref:Haloacid dehalogenase superfamily, subfamily IA, variant 3 with third motif having DD or ED/haloacid dehalogenase superfamily, subfamily IA, variant 1 with third motif having Dx(3-4)D or Dx(3-4)E n=1 Tax=Pilibacter termitis TaxID=263852 RepID=A0A1T4K2U5_9ENTE|nr:HAD-IA family hydrolase [Pilibacter termitis]SJZ36738.1 haloacid dehalogenase superfamily, subfamily IA, variant 3 with third motif having DD or ED/haloacid dehalogenase superfamily, subfamily IA, variant 1 with third motif having Dx(3-4)D or Dx(3-4)E [Pilibacter termitis]